MVLFETRNQSNIMHDHFWLNSRIETNIIIKDNYVFDCTKSKDFKDSNFIEISGFILTEFIF